MKNKLLGVFLFFFLVLFHRGASGCRTKRSLCLSLLRRGVCHLFLDTVSVSVPGGGSPAAPPTPHHLILIFFVLESPPEGVSVGAQPPSVSGSAAQHRKPPCKPAVWRGTSFSAPKHVDPLWRSRSRVLFWLLWSSYQLLQEVLMCAR